MMIYTFITGAIIFLVVGVRVVWRAFKSTDEEAKVEPISNLDDIRKLKKEVQNDSPVLMTENQKLSEALKRELSSKETEVAVVKNQEALEDQKKQLEQARASIEVLTSENHKLKKQMDAQINKGEEFYRLISSTRDEFVEEVEGYQSKIQVLESELQHIQEEKGKLSQGRQSMEHLEAENRNLAVQLEENQNKQKEVQKRFESIKNESDQKMEEAAGMINEMMEKLQMIKGNEVKSQDEGIEKKAGEPSALIEKLYEEQEALLREKMNRDLEFSRMKEFNEHLVEKEKTLQYELTKNRAQSLGLEKICEEFKVQIEEMNKSLEQKEVKA